MNLDETTRLCRLIAAVSPAQRMDAETPATWSVLLDDVSLSDAMECVKIIARRQPFIAPADIVAEAKRLRKARLAEVGTPTPNVDPEDTAAWIAEQRALTAAVADGRMDEAGKAEYERGGRTLTGAAPMYALDGPTSERPAIMAAIQTAGERKRA